MSMLSSNLFRTLITTLLLVVTLIVGPGNFPFIAITCKTEGKNHSNYLDIVFLHFLSAQFQQCTLFLKNIATQEKDLELKKIETFLKSNTNPSEHATTESPQKWKKEKWKRKTRSKENRPVEGLPEEKQ